MSTGMGQIKEVESYSHSGAHAAVGSLMGSVCARCACVQSACARCVCMCVHTWNTTLTRSSENNLWSGLLPSTLTKAPGTGFRLPGLLGKSLCPLSHLRASIYIFKLLNAV